MVIRDNHILFESLLNIPICPLSFSGWALKPRDKSPFMFTCSTVHAWLSPIQPKYCSWPVIAPNHLSAGSFIAILLRPAKWLVWEVHSQLNLPFALERYSGVAFYAYVSSMSIFEADTILRSTAIYVVYLLVYDLCEKNLITCMKIEKWFTSPRNTRKLFLWNMESRYYWKGVHSSRNLWKISP